MSVSRIDNDRLVQESDPTTTDPGLVTRPILANPLPVAQTGMQLDAFNRLRVSNPVTLFDHQAQYNDGTIDSFYHKVDNGGGTFHNLDKACVTMYAEGGSRTNLCLQSENFTTTWVNNETTDTGDTTFAPDSLKTADTIIETAVNDAHYVIQAITIANTTQYTWSVFAKAKERDTIRLFLPAANFPANSFAEFDLTNGTAGTTGGGEDDSGIEDYGNGWYRCYITGTSTAAGAANFFIYMKNVTLSYLGDGTSGLYLWGAQLEAAATPTSYIKTTTAQVSAESAPTVTRQSQRYMRYQPGKSQLILITFDFQAVDGGIKEVGYGDSDNGIFFRMAANGDLSFFKRSKRTGTVVETEVAQASWSEDTFSSTAPNPSGITLDATKSQIFVIDLQWLAVGMVRVGFDIDGMLYEAHRFQWANSNTGVYMSTANLPIHYKLTAGSAASEMGAICSAVMSEGGFVTDLGHEHCTPNSVTGVACATGSETTIVSIRPKALYNGYTNRGSYIPTAITFYVTGNAVLLRAYHGATLAGASWSDADAESGIEYDTTGTHSGGHLTTAEFGAAASGGKAFSSAGGAETLNRVFLTLDIDGNNVDGSNYTLVGQGIGGTATVYANIHWTEIK